MRTDSIAVILCWYGPYPWYLPYFVQSCSYNPTIDFYVITNNSYEIPRKPNNVIIINKALDEIMDIASNRLGFNANMDHPYKLCDFKPAYGFLFPEIIKRYDFWGHSDLDIICGDIRKFLTHEVLKTHDFISLRHDYATGCFALYRNTDKMNTFFMRSKDYKKVFSSPEHFCFDECNFRWAELEEGMSIFDLDTEIESFTHLLKIAERTGEIKVHFDFILVEGIPGRIVFDRGKVIYKKQVRSHSIPSYHVEKNLQAYSSCNQSAG